MKPIGKLIVNPDFFEVNSLYERLRTNWILILRPFMKDVEC